MSKQDITMHSDDELLLLVMNDEALYSEYGRAIHREDFSVIAEVIGSCFYYTEEQLDVLFDDFEQEIEEAQNRE